MSLNYIKTLPSLVILFLVVAILLDTTYNQVNAQENKTWIEVSSDNFKIRSVLSKKKTVELIRNLEMFRASTLLFANAESSNGSIPTEIIVMNNSGDLTQFGLPASFAGIFMPRLRQNFILMKVAGGSDGTHVIQHEYVHFLLRNKNAINFPKWFHEGFAEYLGSAKMERGKFKIGVVPKIREGSLASGNWLPMTRLLAPESHSFWSREMTAMFYAQSWAMVHYLLSTPENKKNFPINMSKYLRLREAGLGGVEAFETAFDVKSSNFGLAVQKYVKTSRFRYYSLAPDDLLPNFEPKIVELSREQASLSLAKLALNFGKLDKAERWYEIASEDEQLLSRAQAGLGDVLKFNKEYEAALPYFEKAVELAPEDHLAHLDLAEYWHHVATKDKDSLNIESLELARKHYLNAWQLENTMPEVYAMYGRTFLDEGKNIERGIEMLEEAQRMLASNLSIRTYLADAYLLAGRYDDALTAARSIIAWSHAESGRGVRAKEIIEIAEEAKQQTDKADATNND